MPFIAKHISVSIDLSAAQVYEFASNPENLPKWAGGLEWLDKWNQRRLDSRSSDGKGEGCLRSEK
jgi:hypothetical protein